MNVATLSPTASRDPDDSSVAVLERPRAGPRVPAPVAPAEPTSLFRRVLQDRAALLAELARGEKQPLLRIALVSFLLTALGGLGLGASAGFDQALAAAVKTPIICLGALAVCFPAFYIFGALQGSKVSVEEVLRLFAVGLGLRGAILAALAPLLLFFSSVGSPYGFLLLLGAVVFGVAEAGFLRTVEQGVKAIRDERGDALSLALVRGWSVGYLAVVAQLTWSMRPIIRHPSIEEFVLFGGPGGNMFTYFFQEVAKLVS